MTLQPLAPAGELAVPETDWDLEVRKWLLEYKESTRRVYGIGIGQWTRWCRERGGDPFAAKRVAVTAWHNDLKASGLAAKTIGLKLSTVASFYAYLVQEAVIDASPAEHIRRPKVGSNYASTISLDAAELEAVIKTARAMGDPRLYIAVTLAASTGIRSIELVNARAADKTLDHGEHVLNVIRKGDKPDRVTMPGWVAVEVDRFVASTGSPWIVGTGRYNADYAWFWRGCERVGLAAGVSTLVKHDDGTTTIKRKLTPHVLRATFATLAIDGRVPLAFVQGAMGHSSPVTTGLYDRGAGKLGRQMEVTNAVAKHIPRPDDH